MTRQPRMRPVRLAATRRLQILSAGAAIIGCVGVLFLADFAFGVGPLVNPLSVSVILLHVGAVALHCVSPKDCRSSRMLPAVLAVTIAGIPWAALVDDFGSTAEAKAALMLPWWLAFLLSAVRFEVNGRAAARRSPLVLLVVPPAFGFLALIYVASVFWAE